MRASAWDSSTVIPTSCIERLSRLHTDTALIYPSEAIDEYPLWSPDGRYLAVNVEGVWQKIDLSTAVLVEATWRSGQPLAVLQNKDSVSPASDLEISSWRRRNVLNPRKATLRRSTVELRSFEMFTSLVISSRGEKPVTRWRTEAENCHSLVVSPDQSHVAFICEMNGVLLLRVAK